MKILLLADIDVPEAAAQVDQVCRIDQYPVLMQEC